MTEEELLENLKNYLFITWDDDDNELKRIIKNGKTYLKEITGTELDFENDDTVIQLLFDYARYVKNHTLEAFDRNFSRELLRLQLREAVNDRAAKKTNS